MATSTPKTIGSRDAIQQARADIVAFLIVKAGLGSIFYVLLARPGIAVLCGQCSHARTDVVSRAGSRIGQPLPPHTGTENSEHWTTRLPCSPICHTRLM